MQKLRTEECSTWDVTMWRFVGLARSAAAMAALLLSVAQEVKITSIGCAPINSATCSRAVSTTALRFDPNLYALDGLPGESSQSTVYSSQ